MTHRNSRPLLLAPCLLLLPIFLAACSGEPEGTSTPPATPTSSETASPAVSKPDEEALSPQPGGGVLAHAPPEGSRTSADGYGALKGFASSLDEDPIVNVDIQETGEGAMVFTGRSQSGMPFRGAVGGEIVAAEYLPGDAPLMSNSTVLAAMSVDEKVLLRTSHPNGDLDQVRSFYQSALLDQEWDLEEIATPSGTLLRARKDGRVLQLSVNPGQAGSLITMTIEEG